MSYGFRDIDYWLRDGNYDRRDGNYDRRDMSYMAEIQYFTIVNAVEADFSSALERCLSIPPIALSLCRGDTEEKENNCYFITTIFFNSM